MSLKVFRPIRCVVDLDDRWTWIVAVALALVLVGVAWFVESSTGQRGVLLIGIVAAVGVLVFVGAMTSVIGQTACEECGIGNPAGASTCWKCGAPLPAPEGGDQP